MLQIPKGTLNTWKGNASWCWFWPVPDSGEKNTKVYFSPSGPSSIALKLTQLETWLLMWCSNFPLKKKTLPNKTCTYSPKGSVPLPTLLEILKEFSWCTLCGSLDCWHSHLLCSGSDFPAMQELCLWSVRFIWCVALHAVNNFLLMYVWGVLNVSIIDPQSHSSCKRLSSDLTTIFFILSGYWAHIMKMAINT